MPQSEHQPLKHQLIEIGMAVFFDSEGAEWGHKYASSEALKEAIILAIYNHNTLDEINKAELVKLATHLKVVPDEERYGTLKFLLPGAPTDSVIRFKRPDAQDVPHTEDFLARLQGQANAARRLLAENPNLSTQDQNQFNQKIEAYFEKATRDILEHCTLDPALIPTHRLNPNDPESQKKHAYLKAQQEKSAFVIQKFSDCLADVLLQNKVVKVKGKKGYFKSDDSDEFKKQVIKNQIYLKETELMSKPRPELVVIRPIQSTKVPHIAVSIVPPMNPERTISSAKKDEQGLANFVSSENWVADSQGKILEKRPPSLRSASLVPQDIFFDAKHDDLIREVTRMNARHHLLPALFEMGKDNPINQGKGSKENPIEINYTLQTLLSPMMEFIDKKNTANPDYLQVTAIRDALNEIADRPVKMPSGQYVKLKVNYVNNGCNIGRGAAPLEDNLNAKAFNQIVDKNIQLIQKAYDDAFHESDTDTILKALSEIPKFSERDQGKYDKFKDDLKQIYEQLDEHRMHPEDHARLTELEVKLKRHESSKFQTPALTKAEKKELKALQEKRVGVNAKRAPLEQQAKKLEAEREKMDVGLYKNKIGYFANSGKELSDKIQELESKSNLTPEQKQVVNHLRAFEQYVQLTAIGYDSKINRIQEKNRAHSNDNNKRNYQVQSALHLLCDYAKEIHHKTCKSGKDRTNSAEEMEQALHQASVITGQVLQLAQDLPWEEDANRKLLISLYNEGYMHGNGNYICGQNMPPGAQQVSSADIPSDIDVDVWKKTLAGFQKAAYKGNHLDNADVLADSHLNGARVRQSTEQAMHLSDSLRHLGHFIHALDQSNRLYDEQSNRLDAELKKLIKDQSNPEESTPKIRAILVLKNELENQKKEIAKIREHVQLMQDVTLKILLLDHQSRHLPEGTSLEQLAEMKAIQARLSKTLNSAYQELQTIVQSDLLFKNNDYIEILKALMISQEAVFNNPKAGLRKFHSQTLNAEALIDLLKIPELQSPKITSQRTLNPSQEKQYVVKYDSKTAPLTVTQRIIAEKQQTELMVTAKTDREQTTLDEATLAHIVKIAQRVPSGRDNQIEVIAPNQQQALQIAIALRTAGIKINLDSFDNGQKKIAFSPESLAQIQAIKPVEGLSEKPSAKPMTREQPASLLFSKSKPAEPGSPGLNRASEKPEEPAPTPTPSRKKTF